MTGVRPTGSDDRRNEAVSGDRRDETVSAQTVSVRKEGGGRGVATTARGSLFGLAGAAANAVFGFVLVAVVTHGLGAGGAGAVFTGVAAFTIVSNALKLGADTALVRFVSRDLELTGGAGVPGLLRTAVAPALLASTAGAAALWSAPGLAGRLLPGLGPGEAVGVVRLFAVFLPVTTVALVLLGATRGYGSVVPFVAVEQIGKPVLRVLLAVPVVLWAPGVTGIGAAWLVPGVLGAAAAWVALRRARRARPGTGRAPTPVREFWCFAGPRAVSALFDIAAVWIGVILLSALGTSAGAGVHTAIGRLVTAGTMLQLAVRLAVSPQISRLLAGGDEAGAQHLHRLSTRWIALCSWPVFVLLAAYPRTVLSLFGPGFADGAPGLVVLAVAGLVNVGAGNAQTVILMAGRSVWNLAVAGTAFVIQLGGGIGLVPRYGVLGAAVAWGLASVVDNGVSALLARRCLGFRTVDRGYLLAALVAVGVVAPLAFGVRALSGDSVPGTFLGTVLSIGAWGILVWRYRVPLGVGEFFGVLRKRGADNSR
ncbi:polysaccharide biosynthesis protein [Streptomyces sp. NBRC 110611]|uniref:polysaccharide biosynthesis C-terminal domain-containing protein n=1 Tax=Streptomyces sp. NBRC 110611 TaxID=1621259 RepID=UPI0008590A87|nr:polysaccharide biosynthesis C-terminal domain-containing protein [Streptomyces sp. NBRC 110611]GAU69258.1 polysaccharide biosynthesis protein [Streptomyces sp. NBRC 110611]